jgi:hypothetical protein
MSGWKLVPVEPTEDMVVSGFESWPDRYFSKPEDWLAFEAMSVCQQAAHKARLCYAAMLAAAPAAPAQSRDSVPVEVWHGERKVTIYEDCVLRVWGANIESEMSDAPRNLQTVQDAIDWLYAAPPTPGASNEPNLGS